MSVLVHRPALGERKSSRVPGGFDTEYEGDSDEQPHAIGAKTDDSFNTDSSPRSVTHDRSDVASSLAHLDHAASADSMGPETTNMEGVNNTMLEEQEMNRRLGDFESSFVPELSHLSVSQPEDYSHATISDNSSAYERNHGGIDLKRIVASDYRHGVGGLDEQYEDASLLSSPKTPPGMYMTPAPEQQQMRQRSLHTTEVNTPDMPNTSALEVMSSSPTAARTVSRVQSMATIGGYETADERDFPESPSRKMPRYGDDSEATPRKSNELDSSTGTAGTTIQVTNFDAEGSPRLLSQRRRPRYLNSRSSNARLSYDSTASSATENSEATLSADFALQSGGAAPESRLQRKPRMTLSRSTSLGSIVSGVSNISDDEVSIRKPVAEGSELSTLQEESPKTARNEGLSPSAGMITPRPSTANLAIPTDTVVTNHARDLEVPGSFARQYRQTQAISPEKPLSMAAMTPGPKKGLTLKEHRSTVEKLGKENFDLKMKIHFLDQALQRRSEDGVKELITENVQLKSDRMRLEKDNHGLRKQVRELQKQLESVNGARESPNADQGYGTDEDRSPTIEEELLYLRERIETSEIEVERLRTENIAKEAEKRRLAEIVRGLGDSRANVSDVGSREERDMWKDMLESETTAREQSEEENKKLRDELAKMRQETFGNGGARSRKHRIGGSVVSQSSSAEGSNALRVDPVETERLRHEVSELQKMISAQASTLTSRNKEKERLYQEIEDLKIGRMGGLRSVAGDSIFDRSASRARSNSRASIGTRFSKASENEREQFEARIGELRDEVSQLKLDNRNLQTQFNEALTELDAIDAQAQADADQFNEELFLLTQERDNALRDAEDLNQAFQALQNEAQQEIDGVGDELDAKVEECARLEQELRAQAESAQNLQNEVRSASEGLIRLEEDAQQNLSRYQTVKKELDNAHRELQNAEKNLSEAESNVQRLTVQQESSHNEIAFLREEQDGDKIKIGDLESLLKKVHLNLDTERDKAKDLERRLGEERAQREAVSSQEKQDVQRMINDLNREATGAKDELRRARKAMSSREIEATTYKEHLNELENGLRHVLGDSAASRATLISTVMRIQRNHEQATSDLDHVSKRLDEHQSLLASRDTLLESSGLECRKMAELLERERQARKQDKHSFEQSLKSHQQAARALSTNTARITELEQARAGQRKQMSQLEAQFKDQLAERNQVLLTLWKKLSALCGPDWAHNHSLINGNLPSQEVVGNLLFWPGFSRNLLLATRQVEVTFSLLRDKIKHVERDLTKEYRNLEHTLEQRTKRLERVEEGWLNFKLRQQEMDAGIHSHNHGQHMAASRIAELQKMSGENRRLKAELQLLQQQVANSIHVRNHTRNESRNSAFSGGGISNDGAMSMDGAASTLGGGIPTRRSSMGRGMIANAALMRHNSESANEQQTLSRSASVISGQSRHGTSDWQGSPERDPDAKFHAMASRPYVDPQPPSNGSYARLPIQQNSRHQNASQQTVYPQSTVNNRPVTSQSDAATLTTAQLMSMNSQEQSKWIHRLRELERRLKTERELRLIDRSGMRKRLEEREAVNEGLRRELERERVRHSWGTDGLSNDINNIDDRDHEDDHAADRERMGVPSLNNRVVEVEGSPVRGN